MGAGADPGGPEETLIKGWPDLHITPETVPNYFGDKSNIGLILGEPSGWLVDVDLDCDEACRLAEDYLPPTDAVSGRGNRPRSHWWYYAEDAQTVKHTDPRTREMIVELRSTGLQTVVGPSVHPDDGDRYDLLEGEPARIKLQVLTACVENLWKAVLQERYGTVPTKPPTPTRTFDDPAQIERRAIAYLEKLPAAISGQGGHKATYTAAVALVHGFGLEPDHALGLLLEHYNPRCEPPWNERDLQHKVDDAAQKSHDKPYGWLRDSHSEMPANDVDISGIVGQVCGGDDRPEQTYRDPGPVPQELMHVPGFVSEVMDFTLKKAPYPNIPLAFCGAMALQSYLCGRKICDSGDLRPNIYLLALASSGTGKDFPRKVNSRILNEIGHLQALKDKVASGEGIQDA